MYMENKVKDRFPITDNLFSNIDYDFHNIITNTNLSILFFSNYGLRTISPVCNNVDNSTIGEMLFSIYHDKWERLYNVYNLDYNPIYNYYDEYKETRTSEFVENHNQNIENDTINTLVNNLNTLVTNDISNTNLRTDNVTQSNTGTISTENIITNDLTQLTTNNLSESVNANQQNNLFGFNSIESVGDTENNGSSNKNNTGTSNIENTGTVNDDTVVTNSLSQLNTGTVKNELTNEGTIKTENTGNSVRTIDNDIKDNKKIDNESSGTKEWKHIGNIGNIPTQSLISQEIELRKWNWVNQILEDVKDFLTIPIYDNRRFLKLVNGQSY